MEDEKLSRKPEKGEDSDEEVLPVSPSALRESRSELDRLLSLAKSSAKTDGAKNFHFFYFPINDARPLVNFKVSSTKAGTTDSFLVEMKNAAKGSKNKEKIWELGSEVITNDEAALRNIINKVKKGNEVLEALTSTSSGSFSERVENLWKLCKINQSIRIQIASVQSALESLNKRVSAIGGDLRRDAQETASSADLDGLISADLDEILLKRSASIITKPSASKIKGPKSEIVRFEVLISKFLKNVPRTLEFDITTNSLSIVKREEKDSKAGDEEVLLTSSTLMSCTLSAEKVDEAKLDYFTSQERLLRNVKSLKIKFNSQADRERFYRLISTKMMSKPTGGKTKYNPEPLKISDSETRARFRSQKFPIDEVAGALHRSWTLEKLEKGWSYGADLDEKRKTHPLLVPFDRLPLTEQQRNSQMVSVTLETIYALGFEVLASGDGERGSVGDAKPRSDSALVQSQISGDLLQLLEFLAENAHDIWAHRKMVEGWKYGPHRDNDKKLHPLLVPYCELEESDRESDRDAMKNVLGTLISTGFKIEKTKSGDEKKTIRPGFF